MVFYFELYYRIPNFLKIILYQSINSQVPEVDKPLESCLSNFKKRKTLSDLKYLFFLQISFRLWSHKARVYLRNRQCLDTCMMHSFHFVQATLSIIIIYKTSVFAMDVFSWMSFLLMTAIKLVSFPTLALPPLTSFTKIL